MLHDKLQWQTWGSLKYGSKINQRKNEYNNFRDLKYKQKLEN